MPFTNQRASNGNLLAWGLRSEHFATVRPPDPLLPLERTQRPGTQRLTAVLGTLIVGLQTSTYYWPGEGGAEISPGVRLESYAAGRPAIGLLVTATGHPTPLSAIAIGFGPTLGPTEARCVPLGSHISGVMSKCTASSLPSPLPPRGDRRAPNASDPGAGLPIVPWDPTGRAGC